MAEMQYAGAAAPLDSYIASDASLQWSDMWGFFRDASSVYNGQVNQIYLHSTETHSHREAGAGWHLVLPEILTTCDGVKVSVVL